jgi:CheY-like chemotaxis protein
MSAAPLLLVVEDDTDNRDVLAEVLTEAGYLVVCAADGRQALEYLQSHAPPAAILTDVIMPSLNGPDLIQYVRATDRLASVPTILLSGSVPGPDQPGQRFLSKPIGITDLLDAVGIIAPLPRPVS